MDTLLAGELRSTLATLDEPPRVSMASLTAAIPGAVSHVAVNPPPPRLRLAAAIRVILPGPASVATCSRPLTTSDVKASAHGTGEEAQMAGAEKLENT